VTGERRTERLLLRRWRGTDREPFARMNADPVVMEHFAAPLTPAQSDAFVDAIEAGFDRNGFGLWAIEVVGIAPFIGFVGLNVPRFDAHFTPAVEIGWRLDRHHWGQGYASEGARSVLAAGFTDAGLDEIVSFTSTANRRSQLVMERIGMHRDPADDFHHPNMPMGHRLAPHVLYRLERREWERTEVGVRGGPVRAGRRGVRRPWW
jgi:RimJ/RimL family protein N-acetyltransferase